MLEVASWLALPLKRPTVLSTLLTVPSRPQGSTMIWRPFTFTSAISSAPDQLKLALAEGARPPTVTSWMEKEDVTR